MHKEFWTIMIVIILIVGLDIASNVYTSKVSQELTQELEQLKEVLFSKEEDSIHEKEKEVQEKWDQYHTLLAYYLEHDELEKVETELSVLKGKIEEKEYNNCLEEIETMTFILSHIQEKEKFSFQSIF